jgi:mediator of RNA polymerase II transcription subunit 25
MAVLQGLVAAVEVGQLLLKTNRTSIYAEGHLQLFDVLRTCTESKPLQSQSSNQLRDTQQKTPRLVCHILHVAASPADGSQKPLWNNSPTLDDVSWETLPAELKKVRL